MNRYFVASAVLLGAAVFCLWPRRKQTAEPPNDYPFF